MDVVIRQLAWRDMESVMSNYYSYMDELQENPWLGLTFNKPRPSVADEIKFFTDLYI